MNVIIDTIEEVTGLDINKDGRIGGLVEEAETDTIVELNRDALIGRKTITPEPARKAKEQVDTDLNNDKHIHCESPSKHNGEVEKDTHADLDEHKHITSPTPSKNSCGDKTNTHKLLKHRKHATCERAPKNKCKD